MTVDKNQILCKKIAEKVDALGGQTYYVGGCVRDSLLGLESKDFDIEVYDITPETLEKILGEFGEVLEMGKSFSVYSVKGYSVDVALPRRERAVGDGHRDFVVEPNPFITTREAAIRRDFTVNAMMKDVLTSEIIDHFGGMSDLKAGVIRHVSDNSFSEDPLRVFRAAQFAARFNFTVANETIALCSKMKVEALPKERVLGELTKALLKAKKPSIFFETLRKMNLLSQFFPEVEALIGVPQSKKYHAEGDAWTHTMMVLDEAAKLCGRVENKLGFMLSALVHDLGKAVATKEINGEIHAYAHETLGLPIVEKFLLRLTNEKNLIKYALNMTENHMKPLVMEKSGSAIKSTNKLFDNSVEPLALIYLSLADNLGKIPKGNEKLLEFLQKRLEIYNEYMARPYVTGKDLVENGLKPGENFSEILSYAHKLRLSGCEKESALKQTLAYAKKLNEKD